MAVDTQALLAALQAVTDPNTGKDFVSTKALKNLQAEYGDVSFDVELGYPAKSQIPALRRALIEAAKSVPGVENVSVNLSVKQIQNADIVETVRAVLSDSGLEPAALELEITESVIMNIEDALAILERLHELGIHLAIDDFGTGYSSLAYLKRLPVNTLKIDRAFVTGIGENAGDEAIIRTIVALARSLKLTTVAEGVENARQADFLNAHGCDEIQGYFFSKPQPADAFAAHWRNLSPPV